MDELSFINIAYNGTASDGWWVKSVLVYRNKKWDTFVAPDASHQVEKSAWIDNDGHPDVEWFDLSERPLVNEILTRWTTSGDSWSGTTNIYLVFYHSETVIHYAGVIYDTDPHHVWDLKSTDCPFPIEDLRMVSVRALKGHIDDGWWVRKAEIFKGGSFETMWSPTWQTYEGGMVAEHDDTLLEPVFTLKKVLLRIVTGSDAGAGSGESFSITFHTFSEDVLVATKVAPEVGEVAVFTVDFPNISELSYISLKYSGSVKDDWQVASVMMYRNRKWDQFYAPDEHMTAQDSASVSDDHPDIEWLDLSERPSVNTIATKWTTHSDSWSGTTNIYSIYYHSETKTHYAGSVYDAETNKEWIIAPTDCPFSADELVMISVRALRGHIDDGWWLTQLELEVNGVFETMYSPTWGHSGPGMIAYHDDKLLECVFTRKRVVFRVTTDASLSYSGSVDTFNIFFHSYKNSELVATKVRPAVGEVAIFNVDFADLAELSYISTVFAGTHSDGWWVKSLELYRDGKWDQFLAPDANHTAEKSAWIDDDGHPDVEWFDFNERPAVNRIEMKWSTDTVGHAGTTNIYTVFLHSETKVHYAGVIYYPDVGTLWNITATDCPFSVDDLRMVSVKSLRGRDDGWWVTSVEVLLANGSFAKMWGQTWQGYSGMVAYHTREGLEPVFTLQPVLFRVNTDIDLSYSGSTDQFLIYFHSYSEDALVATKVAPGAGEVAVFTTDFASIDELAYINIMYDSGVSDGWWVKSVELFKNGAWRPFVAPDANHTLQRSAWIDDDGHPDVEWFDLSERSWTNTIHTRWTTEYSKEADSTNIYTVFFHSETQVHYAGVIYDPFSGEMWRISPTDCPFAVEDLRMVTVKPLRGHVDDDWKVLQVEVFLHGKYQKMWGQTWQDWGGAIAYDVNDPMRETVFSMQQVLMRITTDANPGSGSTDTFSIYLNSYSNSALVATKVSPADAETTILATEFEDIDELVYANIAYNGTTNDAWVVKSLEVYRNGAWKMFTAPDAHGEQNSASVDEVTADVEWFDLNERAIVNTITTRWQTANTAGADSTNIYAIFYHSETKAHYAGVVHDPAVSSAPTIASTDCPFPVEELRMVSVRSLRASVHDNWQLSKVELLSSGNAYVAMWGQTWQDYQGEVNWHMNNSLSDPVFSLQPVLLRITTDGEIPYAGSKDSFMINFYTYDGFVNVAKKVSPTVGEVSVFNTEFAAINELAYIHIVYNGTRNDGWWVKSVELHRDGEWQQFLAVDSKHVAEESAYINNDDLAEIEWFDFNAKPTTNVISTRWHTDTRDLSESSNVYTIYYHSADKTHYAGVVHHPAINGQGYEINATDCPFPVEELVKVSVRSLQGSDDDAWRVLNAELSINGQYHQMWGQTWEAYGGLVGYHLGPLAEPILVLQAPPPGDTWAPPGPTVPPTSAPQTPTPGTLAPGDTWPPSTSAPLTNIPTPAPFQGAADGDDSADPTPIILIVLGIVLCCLLCAATAYLFTKKRRELNEHRHNKKIFEFSDDELEELEEAGDYGSDEEPLMKGTHSEMANTATPKEATKIEKTEKPKSNTADYVPPVPAGEAKTAEVTNGSLAAPSGAAAREMNSSVVSQTKQKTRASSRPAGEERQASSPPKDGDQ
ncbi:hypothetical protein DIPPA_03704 [Diplonema papillatum]|nr:hypothetical protein DIPPA_03704 [Diplonema papillatum]